MIQLNEHTRINDEHAFVEMHKTMIKAMQERGQHRLAKPYLDRLKAYRVIKSS